MTQPQQENEEFLVSLSDFFSICKKAKRKILLGSLLVGLLTTSYSLTKPIRYQVEASFRERESSSPGMNNSSIMSFLMNGNQSEPGKEIISTIKSRRFLQNLIEREGLQTTIIEKGHAPSLLSRIRNNLVVNFQLLKRSKVPSLSDPSIPLQAIQVSYPEEIPTTYQIRFLSDTDFELYSNQQTLNGTLNEPFTVGKTTFTLVQPSPSSLRSHTFTISFSPLATTALDLAERIEIKPSKEDPNLLLFTYFHANRHTATHILNQILESYQGHLEEENQRVASEQIAYLEKREDEMHAKLKEMMDDYALLLSTDLTSCGFADSDTAMQFMANQQNDYKAKLLGIELDIKRHEKVQNESTPYYANSIERERNNAITYLQSKIRDLKQQSDSIKLGLQSTKHNDPSRLKEGFDHQVAKLHETQASIAEAHLLLDCLMNDTPLPETPTLLNETNTTVHSWLAQLDQAEKEWKSSQNKKDRIALHNRWKQICSNFANYVNNLLHFLQVYEKNLQENLAHQQSPDTEFQGISLDTANQLYISYSKQLSELESQAAQQRYIISQMNDPHFEISSLSSVLTDSVSGQMIQKASQLSLDLKDESNTSSREQERIKQELKIQKGFLQTHLDQTASLSDLRTELLKDKISALQRTILGLIQQQTSILEEELTETIRTHLASLNQERELIEQQQKNLRLEMSHLPKEWMAEKLIEQQVKMNEKMVEEITKMVESKNISHNLDLIQSAPVDFALTPIHPKPPHIILYALLGAFLGGFLSLAGVLTQSIMNGLQASPHNLRLANCKVVGSLSRKLPQDTGALTDRDLGTLRRISASLLGSARNQSLLLLEGRGPDFSTHLAELLAKQGEKVLLLSTSFHHAKSQPGLLQYLQNDQDEIQPTKDSTYDFIPSGGVSRFGNELLHSKRFKELLIQLQSKYDWVIAISNAQPTTAEAEALLSLFNHHLAVLHEEKIDELTPLIQLSKKGRLSFLFVTDE